MNIKVTALSAGILLALSTAASAQVVPPTVNTPPAVPPIYNNGPNVPLLNTVNLSAAERSAYGLYEGVLQVVEATINASSCNTGTYNVDVYADGSQNVAHNPSLDYLNEVVVTGNNTNFALTANLSAPVKGRGQQLQIDLEQAGSFNGTAVVSYATNLVYNNVNNMLVSTSSTISVVGRNGGNGDVYSGSVIKDFFRGDSQNKQDPLYYDIFDWGVQAISKLGYPVEKWWQRSESHRDNASSARTVFVKDRLVGASSCRIVIDTTGYNNGSYFWQGSSIGSGTLTITNDIPSAPVAPVAGVEAWNQYPF